MFRTLQAWKSEPSFQVVSHAGSRKGYPLESRRPGPGTGPCPLFEEITEAMSKQHYFFKLIPPRPTFTEDMTDEEGRLMEEHGRYFQEHFAAGRSFSSAPSWRQAGPSGSPCWRSMTKPRLAGLA